MSDAATTTKEAEVVIRTLNPNHGLRPKTAMIGKGNSLLDNNERVYDGDEFLAGCEWRRYDIVAGVAKAQKQGTLAVSEQAWFRRRVKP